MFALDQYCRGCAATGGFTPWVVPLTLTGGALLFVAAALLTPDWFGEGRYQTHAIPLGEQMPAMDTSVSPAADEPLPSPAGQAAVRNMSARNMLARISPSASQVLLAKLATNTDVEAVNQFLQRARPYNNVGSSWMLHAGDYNFTLVSLTTMLYLFGQDPDRLYPETKAHLLAVLLTQDGGTPKEMAPRSGGLVLDTENHHLMTEGSRYLKNQWLATRGTETGRADPYYCNVENGLEAWLIAYLETMLCEGVYEFNSRPYARLTTHALLNLEAFADGRKVQLLARHLLDKKNLQYALGSLEFRRNAPFRRQYRRAADTGINREAYSSFVYVWATAPAPEKEIGPPRVHQHSALLAALLPYRLPPQVRSWTLDKPEHYFVQFGRGASACPEIYSGGPGYVLSAGGANRGWRSRIVARPVTLLLSDGVTDISECFHIPGGGHWRQWNNTGVSRRFAVANAPVHIPDQYAPVAEQAGWRVFESAAEQSMLIATFSAETLGIIALFPDPQKTPESLLAALCEQNADPAALQTRFVWPDGTTLTYEPEAPKGTWVMKTDNGETLDRNYDAWPQIKGDLPAFSFERNSESLTGLP